MSRTISSRRADTGLPDVANDFAYDDPLLGHGTYFDDGTTWTDAAGSVLAGKMPLEEGPTGLSPRGRRRMWAALGERGAPARVAASSSPSVNVTSRRAAPVKLSKSAPSFSSSTNSRGY